MRTFVALFVVSALFGATIGIVYFFVAHEEMAGTMLLALMTAALLFAAAYAVVAEREAHLAGDQRAPDREAYSGEDLGIFTTRSPWPALVALATLGMLTGTLWSPALALGCTVALVYCLWRLGKESAEV